jgi:flagellar export protein FliJ
VSALETLARIARRQGEDIERQLAALEARRREAHARIEAHDRAMENERALARSSVASAMAFGAYAPHALAQRQTLAAAERTLALETEALRDTLRAAFIELKKVETLIDQEAERAAVEQGRRDQAEMDDIAASTTRQKR